MSEVAKGRQMLAEILNQPKAWSDTISILLRDPGRLLHLTETVDEVVFTGCGSGLNAGSVIAPTFQQLTGIRARAVPAAELVFFPETVFVEESRYLVVPISRSGSTTETVLARDAAKSRGLPTLAITCYADSPLARESTEAVVLEPANEESVTTTQSLTGMILCGQIMSGLVSRNHEYLEQLQSLSHHGSRVIEKHHQPARAIAEDGNLRKFAFVGNGPYIGVARECQLKIKEMVLLPSDAYPLLDYRHGPKSNVDEHMLVTVFMSDRARRVELEFLAEMKGLGGNLLVICDRAGSDIQAYADYLVEIESGLPEFARSILYLLPVHFLAFYKSLSEGLDPANPVNLSYWVETTSL
jgi:glutamine---fructose-6-phosphate transaminase (isomerizing)